MIKAKDVVCMHGMKGLYKLYEALKDSEPQNLYLVICIKSMVYFIHSLDGLETVEDHYGHKDIF